MNTPALIGMIGPKRSGKDTFAAALPGFCRVAFADPLKATMMEIDPFVPDVKPGTPAAVASGYIPLSDYVSAWGWEAAKENSEVRRLLQAHGVAIRQHLDEDAWVKAGMGKVRRYRAAIAVPGPGGGTWALRGRPVVVTDVRFPNEATAIREEGGKLVRISRPGLPADDTHISETALNGFQADYVFWNDDTLEAFEAQAREFAASL